MIRGDVYFANLDNPPQGSEQGLRRPVLILQINQFNKVANTIVIVPLTTGKNENINNLPSSVSVTKGQGGLNDDSTIICHQIRAIDKKRLDKRIGTLSNAKIAEVEKAVSILLGFIAP